MRKIVAIAFLLASFYGYSQSIQLFYDKQLLNSDDTLLIEVPSGKNSDHYLDIGNTSDNTIKLKIKRTLIYLVPGAKNSFCFGTCFDDEVDEYSGYDFLPGDRLSGDSIERDDFFYTSYKPNGQGGISIIKYTFSDNNNPSDATSVIFKFDSGPVGIKEITKTASFNVYPNPTTGQLRIEMQHAESNKQQAEIYDIYGKKLSAFCLLPSATEIDISHLSAGIYFLKIDGKVVKMVKE